MGNHNVFQHGSITQLHLCVTKLQVYVVGLVSQQWRLGCVTSSFVENTRNMHMLCYCNTVECLHNGHFKTLLVKQREVKMYWYSGPGPNSFSSEVSFI